MEGLVATGLVICRGLFADRNQRTNGIECDAVATNSRTRRHCPWLPEYLMSQASSSLIERAKRLPVSAEIFATSFETKVLDRFPMVRTVGSDRWDFIMTVAGIFVAISQLNREELDEGVKDDIREATGYAAIKWNPKAVEAVEDCTQCVNRNYGGLQSSKEYSGETQFLFSDSLGFWVVRNLLDHMPESDAERQLVRALGGALVLSFVNWWKDS